MTGVCRVTEERMVDGKAGAGHAKQFSTAELYTVYVL